MITRKSIDSKIGKLIPKFFSDFGFDMIDTNNYVNNEKTFLSFRTVQRPNYFAISCNISRHYPHIENYWEKYRVILEDRNTFLPRTISFSDYSIDIVKEEKNMIHFDTDGKIKITDAKDLEQYLLNLKSHYLNYYTDFLENTKNLTWMDSIINPKIDATRTEVEFLNSTGFWYRRIIIARLADNPEYSMIYEWIRKRFADGYETYKKEKYNKIVQVLDLVYNDLNDIKLAKKLNS